MVGSLQFSDADDDVWPEDFTLTEDDAYNAIIGVANESSPCCP